MLKKDNQNKISKMILKKTDLIKFSYILDEFLLYKNEEIYQENFDFFFYISLVLFWIGIRNL